MTPAEASGIKVEGQNKWITLIRNAKLMRNRDTVGTILHKKGEKVLKRLLFASQR